MRILILSINYWPEETGIGAFTTYRAEFLANSGHEVTVCTTFPYYPEWKVAPDYQGKRFSSETRNGVRILRSYVYVPGAVSAIKRVVHEASFIASSFLSALFSGRPDLLLVVSPPLGLAASAISLSGIWGIPYVFDVEDLQPDAAAMLGMLPNWVLRPMYWLESIAYRRASLVSTITSGMRQRIVEKGVPARKVVLFEPRMDVMLADIKPSEGLRFRAKLGLEGKFIVTHSGNVGEKQGLDVVLDAATLCGEDASLLFLIVGDGAARLSLERRVAVLGLKNVRFLPLLESEEFRGLLAGSDVCLVTQRKSVSDIVFPSKVVTYLAAGKPVIGSVNAGSEVARTIQDSGAGMVVEPENAQTLRDAIYKMRQENLDERNQRARSYAFKRWAPATVLGNLEANLLATLAEHAGRSRKSKIDTKALGSIDET